MHHVLKWIVVAYLIEDALAAFFSSFKSDPLEGASELVRMLVGPALAIALAVWF